MVLKEAGTSYAATILSIGILIWIGFWMRSWYQDDSGPAEDAHDLLLQFKELKRQGDLTDDEYRSIKGRLAGDGADSSRNAMDSQTAEGHEANPPEV